MQKDTEVVLHYIDRVHIALHETGKSVNFYAMATVVLSLTLIGMTSGLASADDKVSALGLTITLPSWLFPLALSSILMVAHSGFLSLVGHETRLREVIVRLYQQVGFSDQSLSDLEASPLEYPTILTLLCNTRYSNLGKMMWPLTLLLMGSLILLPLTAAVFAAVKLVTLKPTWWMITAFAVILLLGITYLMAFLRSVFSRRGSAT